MKRHIVTLMALVAFSIGAHAADSLKVATGKSGKGYSKIFANIQKVCGTSVPLMEINTNGALENLGALSAKEALLAPVDYNTYQTMVNSDDSIGRLKAVMSLNANMLQIVVNQSGYAYSYADQNDKECVGGYTSKCIGGDMKAKVKAGTKVIETVEDIKGLRVAAVGSAQVLAQSYFNKKLGYNLKVTDVDPDDAAFKMLAAKQVDVVLTMAAHPNGNVLKLTPASGFALAKYTLPPSGPFKVVKKNYKNLGAFGVPFLTTQNLLMARPIDPASETGQQVTQLKACIVGHLKQLQDEDGFEPSWADASAGMAVPDDVPAWTGVLAGKKK